MFLEAEGEPAEGMNGVAWTVRNRVDQWRITFHQAILGPEAGAFDDGKPFEPFSCWNDDYKRRAEARLAAAAGSSAELAWRAAAGALWRLISSPIENATFYLNVQLTLRVRPDKRLPAWAADPANPTRIRQDNLVAQIGRHHFLRG